MWHFGIWFSRHGGVELMIVHGDLRGLFQPQGFYDSMIPHTTSQVICTV